LVPELYSPIYKGVFSDICPLLSAPNFLAMITPAQIAWYTKKDMDASSGVTEIFCYSSEKYRITDLDNMFRESHHYIGLIGGREKRSVLSEQIIKLVIIL
jgi:hypothetical protein